MYTSGQFAGMFRVSKKLLRHYTEIGLLRPAEVEPANGYYRYGQAEHDKMKQIMYLRALKLPLPEIKKLLDLPRTQWVDGIHQHLVAIREQQRRLMHVETELVLLEEQILKGASMNNIDKQTEYHVRVFRLEKEIWVIGRGVRIKHGSPEHMPSIQNLIENFFGDDVPAIIPHHMEPAFRFGICAEFTPETGEFTYIMGDQTSKPVGNDVLPDTLRGYMIPAGDYACVTFSAPDIETITIQALGLGYDKLFGWLGDSAEWENSGMGVAYEVYEDKRFEVASWPEMDIWTPVKRK